MLESFMWSISECLVGVYVDTICHDYDMSEKDKSAVVQFYKCQLYGQISCWLNSGMKEDILSLNKRLTELKKELLNT
jgi:hypothetical protein